MRSPRELGVSLLRTLAAPTVGMEQAVRIYSQLWTSLMLGSKSPNAIAELLLRDSSAAEYWFEIAEALEWLSPDRVRELAPLLASRSSAERLSALHLLYWWAQGGRGRMPVQVAKQTRALLTDPEPFISDLAKTVLELTPRKIAGRPGP